MNTGLLGRQRKVTSAQLSRFLPRPVTEVDGVSSPPPQTMPAPGQSPTDMKLDSIIAALTAQKDDIRAVGMQINLELQCLVMEDRQTKTDEAMNTIQDTLPLNLDSWAGSLEAAVRKPSGASGMGGAIAVLRWRGRPASEEGEKARLWQGLVSSPCPRAYRHQRRVSPTSSPESGAKGAAPRPFRSALLDAAGGCAPNCDSWVGASCRRSCHAKMPTSWK